MTEETKFVQLKFPKSLWEILRNAAEKEGVSVAQYCEKTSREHPQTLSAARRLKMKIPPMAARSSLIQKGLTSDRVLQLIGDTKAFTNRDIVDELEPKIQGDTDCGRRRDLVRNAIQRLVKNETLIENKDGRLSKNVAKGA